MHNLTVEFFQIAEHYLTSKSVDDVTFIFILTAYISVALLAGLLKVSLVTLK